MSCPYTKEQLTILYGDLAARCSKIPRRRIDEAWDEMADKERGMIKIALLLQEMFGEGEELPSRINRETLLDRAATQMDVCHYAANDYAERDEYVTAMLRSAEQFAKDTREFFGTEDPNGNERE
jgi:hypothetical protein